MTCLPRNKIDYVINTADSLVLTLMFTDIAQHVLGPDFTCLCSVLWLWRWGQAQTWVQAMNTMESQSKLSSLLRHMWSAFFLQYKALINSFPTFFRRRKPWKPKSCSSDHCSHLACCAIVWNFLYFAFVIIFEHFFLYICNNVYTRITKASV